MNVAGRLALTALVIAAAISSAATERIDVSLLFWQSVAWSFVPLLQLLTGLLLIRGHGRTRTSEALTAYFDTHGPWSLWLLAVSATLVAVPPARAAAGWLLLTAAVPAVLTARALFRLCIEAFGMTIPIARRRVTMHQLATLALLVGYFSFAVALWPRLIAWCL